MYPNDWSPDGRSLVFQRNQADGGWDLATLHVDDAGRPVGEPTPLSATPFRESSAVISPDGRWVAYESDEVDGLVQVYARSFPDGGHKVLVSSSGARWPAWGRAGDLYYWDTGQRQVSVARIRREGSRLVVNAAEPVWGSAPPERVVVTVAGARFDVHPSGTRFLMLETAAPSVEPPLTRPVVLLGWRNVLESRKPLPL
jgi:dipeptidyl aminopeptidase/acylaminoacyl peptidase